MYEKSNCFFENIIAFNLFVVYQFIYLSFFLLFFFSFFIFWYEGLFYVQCAFSKFRSLVIGCLTKTQHRILSHYKRLDRGCLNWKLNGKLLKSFVLDWRLVSNSQSRVYITLLCLFFSKGIHLTRRIRELVSRARINIGAWPGISLAAALGLQLSAGMYILSPRRL